MTLTETASLSSTCNQYSTVPGQSDPYFLAESYRKNLVKSYHIHFQKIVESLKVDLSFFIQRIENLDVKKRFSPAFFVFYDYLKEGYRAKNLHQIFDALQSFKNLKDDDVYVNELRYSTILSDLWEYLTLNDLRQTPFDEQGNPCMKPFQMLSLVHWENKHYPPSQLKEAIDLLDELDPDIAREFHAYVTDIKLYAGKVLESTTSARFFGAIYLRLPYPEENPLHLYLRNLTHELSHLHLYAMMADDPVILNHESERFSSPLRVDRRPMVGIFHAAFVLSRMVRIFRKFLAFYPEDNDALLILKKNEQSFLEGLETIQTHGRLTERGQDIFKSMKLCAFE